MTFLRVAGAYYGAIHLWSGRSVVNYGGTIFMCVEFDFFPEFSCDCIK